jgi:uncharacterized membrane protein YfcA
MDDEQPPDSYMARRPGKSSRPSTPMERAIGYAIPMIVCAVLGAGLVGYVYASGGPGRRRGQVDRALKATRSGLAIAATLGALAGAGLGFFVAHRMENDRLR